jgi:hypothetical protein
MGKYMYLVPPKIAPAVDYVTYTYDTDVCSNYKKETWTVALRNNHKMQFDILIGQPFPVDELKTLHAKLLMVYDL